MHMFCICRSNHEAWYTAIAWSKAPSMIVFPTPSSVVPAGTTFSDTAAIKSSVCVLRIFKSNSTIGDSSVFLNKGYYRTQVSIVF